MTGTRRGRAHPAKAHAASVSGAWWGARRRRRRHRRLWPRHPRRPRRPRPRPLRRRRLRYPRPNPTAVAPSSVQIRSHGLGWRRSLHARSAASRSNWGRHTQAQSGSIRRNQACSMPAARSNWASRREIVARRRSRVRGPLPLRAARRTARRGFRSRSEAIRGHHRKSEVIRGHQRPSPAR